MQTRFFDTAVNIAYCIFITSDDMKIRSNFYTSISYGVGDIRNIVNCKFLGNYIDDLITSRDICFVLIINQLINLMLTHFLISAMTNHITTGLQAFNVMSGNTDINLTNLKIGVRCKTIIQGSAYRLDGLIDIEHLPMFYTIGVSLAKS